VLLNCLSEIVQASELDTANTVAVFDSHLIALDDTIWYSFPSCCFMYFVTVGVYLLLWYSTVQYK